AAGGRGKSATAAAAGKPASPRTQGGRPAGKSAAKTAPRSDVKAAGKPEAKPRARRSGAGRGDDWQPKGPAAHESRLGFMGGRGGRGDR
ncbi:rRNA pseudouridine synthase, partial [Bordetella avium]